MLQVKKQVDVVCSAIGKGTTFAISYNQCVAIGKILGELGFVNERGENPLDLIQQIESEEETSDRPEIEV
jgi:hypothetical protein